MELILISSQMSNLELSQKMIVLISNFKLLLSRNSVIICSVSMGRFFIPKMKFAINSFSQNQTGWEFQEHWREKSVLELFKQGYMDNISNKWSFKVYRKSHLSSTSWKRMWGRWWRNQVRFSQKRLVGIQKRTYNSFSCLCNFCSFAWCKSTEDLASRIVDQRLRRTGIFLSPIGFCLYPCCCWKVWDEGSPNQCWRSEVCQWLPFFSLCHQKDGLL